MRRTMQSELRSRRGDRARILSYPIYIHICFHKYGGWKLRTFVSPHWLDKLLFFPFLDVFRKF
jgi:hypothetical protein